MPPFATATIPVTFVALPSSDAVMVPALKFPEESLKTIVLVEFELVALLFTVKVILLDVLAEKLADPDSPSPETAKVKVPSSMSEVIARVPVEVGNVKVFPDGDAEAIKADVPLVVPVIIRPEEPIVVVFNVAEFITGLVSVLLVKI